MKDVATRYAAKKQLRNLILFGFLIHKDRNITPRMAGYFQSKNITEEAKSEFQRLLISKSEYFKAQQVDFKKICQNRLTDIIKSHPCAL